MKNRAILTCLGVILLARSVSASPGLTYHLTPIGPPGSVAYAINENRQIAGVSNQLAPFAIHSFVVQPDLSLVDLLTLGGTETYAYDINDLGQVVGWSSLSTEPNPRYHAFRANGTQPLTSTNDLGTLGGNLSVARGINNRGEVVGQSETSGHEFHAFRTRPNQPLDPTTDDLGTFGGGTSHATAINNAGQVVGGAEAPDNTVRAFRTLPNAPLNAATDDLGRLFGFTNSFASDINSAGEVVGSSYTSPATIVRSFRTGPNQMIDPTSSDLGTLGAGSDTAALSINDFGWVVGWATTNGEFGEHAFVHDGVGIIDLNDHLDSSGAGWTLLEAQDINNAGQIVGFGLLDVGSGNSDIQAFVLDLIAVPEPSSATLAIFAAMAAAAGCHWRGRLLRAGKGK